MMDYKEIFDKIAERLSAPVDAFLKLDESMCTYKGTITVFGTSLREAMSELFWEKQRERRLKAEEEFLKKQSDEWEIYIREATEIYRQFGQIFEQIRVKDTLKEVYERLKEYLLMPYLDKPDIKQKYGYKPVKRYRTQVLGLSNARAMAVAVAARSRF